jgi:hypothetical protein
MMYYYDSFFSPLYWLHPLFMVLFWGLVIWGVVMLVKRGDQSGHEFGKDRRYLVSLR